MSAAVVMMMMLFVFAGAVIYYFVTRPEEGDECEGKDDNGVYEIDGKGKCVLKSCKTGYYKSGEECLVNLSGSDCEPTGTKDPQGMYLTDKTGGCELSSCATGYKVVGDKCEVDYSIPIDFVDSKIPGDAMVIKPGELIVGTPYNVPKDSTATTRKYYLLLQDDRKLVWIKQGTADPVWNMDSQVAGASGKVYFQGDGNICARGDQDACTMKYDLDVPSGQHRLVGTKEGLLYVDHGTGVAGRSVLYTPTAT
jgi:hypothetical protein